MMKKRLVIWGIITWLFSFKLLFCAVVVALGYFLIHQVAEIALGLVGVVPGADQSIYEAAVAAYDGEVGATSWFDYLHDLDFFIDLGVMVECLVVMLLTATAVVVYKMIWRAIPGVG